MSSRANKKAVIVPKVDPSKLEKIKAGIKTKSESGVKQNQNVTVNARGDKIIAVQKEKKVEESGVTRKKRNFVMYESKTGTEKDVDLLKLQGAKKKAPPRPKVEETIISKHKKKEYLDNFQYHETKELKKKKPAVVIHNRVSNPITGTVEESYQQVIRTSNSAGKTRPGGQRTTTTTTTKTTKTDTRNQSTGNLRGRPQGGVSATKSMESTTKVGRRGGAGGKTSETTTTKKETRTTTTKGGERKTSTRTTTSRGRK